MLHKGTRTMVKSIAAFASMTMLLTACGQQAGGGAKSTGVSTGVYKIGVVAPVTGQLSALGTNMVAGLKFKVEQLNKAGTLKKPIQLVIENDESVEANTVTKTKRMVDDKEVIALLGFSGSALCLAASDTTNREGILNACFAASERITNPMKKWTFTNFPHGRMESQTVLQWLKNMGVAKIAVVYEDSAFGQSGATATKEEAGKFGIALVATESYLQADRDMTAQLTKVKAAGAQAIISWDTSQTAAAVRRGVRQLGIDMPVIHSSGSAGLDFIQLAGQAANGAFAITDGLVMVRNDLPDGNPTKASLIKVADEYKLQSGKEIETFAAGGIDMAGLTAEALSALEKQGKEVNRANFRDAWEGITGYSGVQGVFNYKADNHIGLSNATNILWVQDGKWRLYVPGDAISAGKAKL